MQVTDQIHAIKIPFKVVVRPGLTLKRFVYTYFILDERVVLIDCAVAGAESTLFAYLREQGYSPQQLQTVLLTHAHPDHIGALAPIRGQSGCRVWAHAQARPWIEDLRLQARERPVPGLMDLVAGSVVVDHELQEGDVLECGGGRMLHVLHTPGHSAGSLSFWLSETGVLFTGDALCVGAGFPVYEDVETCWRSIQRLADIPGVQHLLGSWDKPRQAHDIQGVYRGAFAFLRRVHTAVRDEARVYSESDIPGLTRAVLRRLELPEVAHSPVVRQAIASHVPVMDRDLDDF